MKTVMLTTTRKAIRCPQCGSRNAAGTRRCRICTRPFDTAPGTTNAQFEEQLWANPVSRRPAREPISRVLLLAIVIVAAVLLNYFVLRKGPEWAHEPEPVERGASWRPFTSDDGTLHLLMPGDPAVSSVATPAGTMTVAQTWIDDGWNAIRDRHTVGPGVIAAAREHYYALVTLGTVAAPADPSASASSIVTSILPGITTERLTATEVAFAGLGRQFDVTANFAGWPDTARKGTLRARVIVHDGRAIVIAGFFSGQPDAELVDRLVDDELAHLTGTR